MPEKIRVTREELFGPKVDLIVAEQEALQRALPGLEPTPLWRRILFSSLFFLAVAGGLGGIAGWMVLEPFFTESVVVRGTIEEVQLPTFGDSQGRMIIVRGFRILIDDRITRVRGEDDYADVERVRDLKPGHPVRARAMISDNDSDVLLGERIVVRSLPPDHQKDPRPNLRELSKYRLLSGILGFAIVGSCIAGLIAAADGFMSRNMRRGLLSGACGIGIAAGGGLVGLIPAGLVFRLAGVLALHAAGGPFSSDTATGWSLLIMVVGRSLAWGIVGLCVGLGPGAALRSKKLFVNGLVGGMLGGLLGGVFFDPIIKVFADTDLGGEALMSRAFGFAVVGLSAGFMIGLVEHLAKDAWLLMRAGPLAGKQFVIYKNPTRLGSSPKCEIYLFKDPDVAPRHALIREVGSRHEIQDLDSPAGTFVNGQQVRRQTLRDGDQIMLGGTVLAYAERSRGD